MLKSNYKNTLIVNSLIELGDDLSADTKGKGRKFVSRFIEAGVAHYEEFGDILITKETLNKFIDTMVGCPVIIKHKDIDDKNADKERVGVVSKVWYDDKDGWFYCEGIIWDKQAIDLVKNQGWNVSCTYDFDSDKQAKIHNGKKIDMEFTGGEFLHLALVPNPRYERANIVLNSQDIVENEDRWITIHPNGEDEKGRHLLLKDGETPKEAIDRTYGKGEKSDTKYSKRKDIEHNGAKISIIPDGKYSDIKIDAPEGKTFGNGDTWYRTQALTEKAEEHAKKIIDGEFGQSDTKDGGEEIEIDQKDLDWIKTQPMEKIPSLIEAYRSTKRANIEAEKKRQQALKEQNEKKYEEKRKRDEEALEQYRKGREKSTKEAQSMTLEEYLDSKGVKARKGAIYELHKYDWEQAQEQSDKEEKKSLLHEKFDKEFFDKYNPEGKELPKDFVDRYSKKEDKKDLYSDQNFEYNAKRLNEQFGEKPYSEWQKDVQTLLKKYNKTEDDFDKVIGARKDSSKQDKGEDGRITINKPNSNKRVNIRKDGDVYRAFYVQDLGEENQHKEQVLEAKDFANEKNAKKWANKVLEIEADSPHKEERTKIVYKEDKDYDGSVVGIFEDEHGEYQALTPTVSKTFKTIKGAEKFLEGRGYKKPKASNASFDDIVNNALAEVIVENCLGEYSTAIANQDTIII